MSKQRKKKRIEGTAELMLAAGSLPAAGQEAQAPVTNDVADPIMSTTAPHEPTEPSFTATPEPTASAVDAAVPDVRAQTPAPPAPVPHVDASHGTLGRRLRAAREAKGWSADDIATRLRFPAQIVQTLEADQYEKIGYGVYLRGYLSSYARLVGVPTVLIDPVLRERSSPPPPLISSGTISHSRYLYQRYSVSALYLILTAVIIVPAVMLAMRASQDPGAAQITALSPVANPAEGGVAAPSTSADTDTAASTQNAPAPAVSIGNAGANDAPLVASLAPFPALSHKDSSMPTHSDAQVAVGSGVHTLKLSLKESSWVEVVSADGEKLEYGLLPAGSVRTYSSDKTLDVRLGNCNGAEVETDGKPQDLAPFRHANVAHFKLFGESAAISHGDF